jgi:predicted PurR-regulated permease PerM
MELQHSRRILTVFFFATLIVAAELAFYSARWIIALTLLGIGIGVIISPAFDYLHAKFKFPRPVSMLAAALLFMAMVAGLAFFLINIIGDQVSSVSKGLPEILDRAAARAKDTFERFPWIQRQLSLVREQPAIQELLTRSIHALRIGSAAIVGIVFVNVVAFYIALNPTYYFDGLVGLIPSDHRSSGARLLRDIATNLRRWFRSQLIAMALVGTLTTFALWIIGVDYWLLFGFLTGILDIIPYIGPLIPAVGAIIVTFATHPEKLLWIVVAYILIQQAENHIVIPNVMKQRMNFPPVPLMVSLLIMIKWFGLLGVLLTPGLFTILITAYSQRKYRTSS